MSQTRYGFTPPRGTDIGLSGDFNDWLSQQDPSIQTEMYAAQAANPSEYVGSAPASIISGTVAGIPKWAILAGLGLVGFTVLGKK